MRSLPLALVFWAMASHGCSFASEDGKLELPEKLFTDLVRSGGHGDAYGDALAMGAFMVQIPADKRLAALVAILDHPYPDPKDRLIGQGHVGRYLSQHPELKWDSYPPLCLRIHSMLLSAEHGIHCAIWLGLRKGPEYVRPLLIAALSHPDDEVRGDAVSMLIKLGDAWALLEEYARMNQDCTKYAKSAARARAATEWIKREKTKAKEEGAKKP